MSTPHGGTRTVAITGVSSLTGSALSEALRARGDHVVHLVRRASDANPPGGVREVSWDPREGTLDVGELDGVDAVVHLSAANFVDKRWSEDYKKTLIDSRVDGTRLISSVVASISPRPRLLSRSAVAIYGDRGQDVLTEESRPGTGFAADLCTDWEGATWQAERAGAPVAHLRFGIVLSHEGGAMAKVLPLARAGMGGPLGSGRQFWSWITLPDHVEAMLHLLDRPDITGPVNLVSPDPRHQGEVMKALGDRLNRPSVLPAPTIALRLALGEMASEIVGSRRVLPTVLQESGFEFAHPDLESAMAWLAERD